MRTYVLQSRSGCEQEACRRLRQMGFEAFVPMKTMQLRSGGTWFEKTLPIFSQYIFLRFEPSAENYHLIRSVDGVVRFLGDGRPQAITAAEEAYIRWLWNDGKPLGVSKVQGSRAGTAGTTGIRIIRGFPHRTTPKRSLPSWMQGTSCMTENCTRSMKFRRNSVKRSDMSEP